MRALAIGAVASLALGCYYPVYRTEVVAPAATADLRSGDHRDDLVLPTASGGEVRIGADTWVRIRRKDGTATGAYLGSELRVGPDGIASDRQPRIINEVRAVRVSGLGPKTSATLHEKVSNVERVGPDTVRIESVGVWAPLLHDLRAKAEEAGEPAGRWVFELPNGSRYEVAGDDLDRVVDEGFETTEGVRWGDVQALEVASARPGATLGATVGIAVFQMTLGIVVAAVTAGASFRWTEGGPTFAPEVAAVPLATPSAPAPLAYGDTARLVDVGRTEPLFDGARRWRAEVDPSVSLQTGIDPRGLLEHRATVAIRGEEHWELGGGVRILQPRSIREAALLGGFGYLASVFPLDVRRRFEIVLGLDLGGSHDVGFCGSFDAGLRFRLARGLFTGVYPANPTLTGTALVDGSSFAFPTRAELLWLF